MTANEETDNQEVVETLDEAALNEEAARELAAMVAEVEAADPSQTEEAEDESDVLAPPSQSERTAIIEALIFVSEEPLSVKSIAGVLKEDRDVVAEAVR